MRVAHSARESELRAALTTDPPTADTGFATDLLPGKIFTLTWPGFQIDQMALPDPQDLVGRPETPPGYALEMDVALDTSKFPALAKLAGGDGTWRLTVRRQGPPDFTACCLDDPRVALPYPPGARLFHLDPGAHPFRATFTKPMDRPSVEPLVQVSAEGAWDGDGMPVFFTEDLAFLWGEEEEVVRRRSEGASAVEPVLPPGPPGVAPVGWSPGGAFAVGMEPYVRVAELAADGEFAPYPDFLPWLCRAGEGTWNQPPGDVSPAYRAFWLDDRRLFLVLARRPGWQIVDVVTGEVRTVDLEPGHLRPLYHPVPAGDRVAIVVLSGPPGADGSAPVDLVITDLAGRELVRSPGITSAPRHDSIHEVIPPTWLPGGEGLLLVDQVQEGDRVASRLLRFSLADGSVRPIPGSEGLDGRPVVFPGPDTGALLCAAWDRDLDKNDVVVIDLDTGRRAGQFDLGDITAGEVLPSPDGRRLASPGSGESPRVTRRSSCWSSQPPVGWSVLRTSGGLGPSAGRGTGSGSTWRARDEGPPDES